MGANACTFVFSVYSAKHVYCILDKGIAGNDKVFLLACLTNLGCERDKKVDITQF